MTREEAIYYLQSSGFSEEQIATIERALEQEPKTDMLDKIRDEISKLQTYKCFEDTEKLVALDEVLQIIDKYRGEKV